jgi:hypothetical protein
MLRVFIFTRSFSFCSFWYVLFWSTDSFKCFDLSESCPVLTEDAGDRLPMQLDHSTTATTHFGQGLPSWYGFAADAAHLDNRVASALHLDRRGLPLLNFLPMSGGAALRTHLPSLDPSPIIFVLINEIFPPPSSFALLSEVRNAFLHWRRLPDPASRLESPAQIIRPHIFVQSQRDEHLSRFPVAFVSNHLPEFWRTSSDSRCD